MNIFHVLGFVVDKLTVRLVALYVKLSNSPYLPQQPVSVLKPATGEKKIQSHQHTSNG